MGDEANGGGQERGGGAPGPGAPDLDFDIDALAEALQLGGGPARRDDLPADDGEIEELDEILEVPEEPTHPRRLYLVVDGRAHAVTKERFVIGRVSSQCDLAIIDANISRQHCAIERRDGQFFVMDLGSTNGVLLDGVRIDNRPIEDGDELVLSGHRVQCTFELPELELTSAPVGDAASPASIAAGVTGRLAAVPLAHAPAPPPEPEPEPEPELDPDGAIDPELPAEPELPATFEARVELRLAAMAADIAALGIAVQKLVKHVEALEGVDALARLIQRRLEQAKRPR